MEKHNRVLWSFDTNVYYNEIQKKNIVVQV